MAHETETNKRYKEIIDKILNAKDTDSKEFEDVLGDFFNEYTTPEQKEEYKQLAKDYVKNLHDDKDIADEL